MIPPSSKSGPTGWPWDAETCESKVPVYEWPKISVVTPSYNQGEFLEETIRSVLCQGYPNLEYVIIDGGSTDQSTSIIKKYDPWLEYWESRPDRGQAHAINKGLEKSSGDIVAYLNSDDIYLPETLRTVARFFSYNPKVDLVYGNCKVLDELSRPVVAWQSRPFDPIAELCRNFIFQPTVFWRSSLFKKIGYFNEHLQYVMDIDYWYRAQSAGELAFLDANLACFRLHGKSKTGQGASGFVSERKAVLDAFFECNSDEGIEKSKKLVYAWHYYHAGEQLYNAGEFRDSREAFYNSLKINWFSLRGWYILLSLIDGRLGSRFFASMQKLHHLSP